MADTITSREIAQEIGIRDYERVSLEKFAGFPRGEKRDPSVMQSRIRFSRKKIEKWLAAMDRVRRELEAPD